MKISNYNHFFAGNKFDYIFNARTLALASFEKSDEIFKSLCIGDIKNINEYDCEMLEESGFLLNSEINELDIINDFLQMSRYQNQSVSFTLAPTTYCNFKCSYCFERDSVKSKKFNKETEKNLLEFINNSAKGKDLVSVTWYGGEPLLAIDEIKKLTKNILDICKVNDTKFSGSILTNGYLMNEKVIDELLNLDIHSIQVPLDGSREYHDNSRYLYDGKGTYDIILGNLQTLKKIIKQKDMEDISISIRINVTRDNMNSIDQVMKDLENLDLLDFVHPYLAHITDLEDSEFSYTLTQKEFAELEFSFLKNYKYDKENMSMEEFYPRAADNICGASSMNSYVVDPLGDVYKCYEHIGLKNHSLGNINSHIEDIKPKSYYKFMYFNPIYVEKCKECKILPICMGGECPLRRINGQNQNCKVRYESMLEKLKLYISQYDTDINFIKI